MRGSHGTKIRAGLLSNGEQLAIHPERWRFTLDSELVPFCVFMGIVLTGKFAFSLLFVTVFGFLAVAKERYILSISYVITSVYRFGVHEVYWGGRMCFLTAIAYLIGATAKVFSVVIFNGTFLSGYDNRYASQEIFFFFARGLRNLLSSFLFLSG